MPENKTSGRNDLWGKCHKTVEKKNRKKWSEGKNWLNLMHNRSSKLRHGNNHFWKKGKTVSERGLKLDLWGLRGKTLQVKGCSAVSGAQHCPVWSEPHGCHSRTMNDSGSTLGKQMLYKNIWLKTVRSERHSPETTNVSAGGGPEVLKLPKPWWGRLSPCSP